MINYQNSYILLLKIYIHELLKQDLKFDNLAKRSHD